MMMMMTDFRGRCWPTANMTLRDEEIHLDYAIARNENELLLSWIGSGT